MIELAGGSDRATARRRSVSQVVADSATRNAALGHVIHGVVSRRTGFVPAAPPAAALPRSHRAWDQIAGALPDLIARLRHREALADLPLLPASRDALPDTALTRAATVLGLLAHAWTHLGPGTAGPLPAALGEPWAEVCRRLGRPAAMLTYDDLIANNWRPVVPSPDGILRVEHCRLLVPTVGNEEEHRFYLTQLEILSRAASIVDAVARAGDAVSLGDTGALAAALAAVAAALREITRVSLPKIDPRVDAPFHVDPLVWAKTVAPLAVPIRDGPPGPSGTSSPLFHLLDVVLGRGRYASALGREALEIRRTHPEHWREVVTVAAALDLPGAVAAAGDGAAADALREARIAYAGAGGLLARHRLKVMGYIELGFRVGRSVTIGGFAGALHERPWHAVGDALDASLAERDGSGPGRAPLVGGTRTSARPIALSALLARSARSPVWWVAIDGEVYDVTGFAARHPGGPAILLTLAGLDASAAFGRVGHAGAPGVRHALAALRVGRLATVAPAHRRAHAELGRLAMLAVEYDNTLLYEGRILTARTGPARPATPPPEPTALQRGLVREAHARHTGDIRAHLLPRIAAWCGAALPPSPAAAARSPAAALAADLAFTGRLARILRDGLAALESGATGATHRADLDAAVGRACRAWAEEALH